MNVQICLLSKCKLNSNKIAQVFIAHYKVAQYVNSELGLYNEII